MAADAIVLKAELRKTTGKEEASRLRKQKKLPGVVYGPGLKESVNITMDYNEFEKFFQTYAKHHIVTLEVGKEKYNVIVKDYKFHPVKRNFLHIDFFVIVPGREFQTDVPINYIGVPVGVKEGGNLFTFKRKLTVRATDKTLPDKIDVDISNVKAKQYMIVRDIQTGGNYKIITHEGNVLVEVK